MSKTLAKGCFQRRGALVMMPKRVAETDPFKQIDEYVGSGPFIFKKDEWKPGEKVVYVRNPDYKAAPRAALGPGRAARSPRSTASNGCGSPTPRPRLTPCCRARST